MRSQIKSLFKILVFLLLLSCKDNAEFPPETNEYLCKLNNFNIAAAQAYFESQVRDLVPLHFTDSIASPLSAGKSSPELPPEWDKATRSTNPEVSLIEVPIFSNIPTISTLKNFKEGKNISSQSIANTTRLVVARHKTGQTDMFIITLVPLAGDSLSTSESIKNFRYLGGGNFTGKVFCSTLEGRLIEVYQYINGKRGHTIKVIKRSNLTKKGINLENDSYESIRISIQ